MQVCFRNVYDEKTLSLQPLQIFYSVAGIAEAPKIRGG